MRPEEHEAAVDAAAPRRRLRHVHWIGGGSGAGQSTVSRRLAARYGWCLYATDEFIAINMDERRVDRYPETSAIDGRATPGEGFVWRTSDPERANRNLAARDRMFVKRLHEDTASLELHTIKVDTTMTEDDLAKQVSEAFGL